MVICTKTAWVQARGLVRYSDALKWQSFRCGRYIAKKIVAVFGKKAHNCDPFSEKGKEIIPHGFTRGG